jgi:uncharacterized protein (DUF2336 family)
MKSTIQRIDSGAGSQLALIEELNEAASDTSPARRAEMLQQVTDLFTFGSSKYSDDEIALFDDIFVRLATTIEASARAKLAHSLAKLPHAPPLITRALAFDDEIDIAGPVLEHSERLDNSSLVENARAKSQQHLLAISRRRTLDDIITDVLVERGDRPVLLSAAANPGAKFSDTGFRILVSRSQHDDELTDCVGSRRDIPRHHLLKLMANASHAVRTKLQAADPLMSDVIRRAVAEATAAIQSKTAAVSREYAAACAHVKSLHAAGRLNEDDIAAFAQADQFEETTAALATLSDVPIEVAERAMVQVRAEAVMIIAKAIGLSWPTVKAVLKLRAGSRGISVQELEGCLGTYSRLKRTTAEQIVTFQRNRSRPH